MINMQKERQLLQNFETLQNWAQDFREKKETLKKFDRILWKEENMYIIIFWNGKVSNFTYLV